MSAANIPDTEKSNAELIQELKHLRQQVADYQVLESVLKATQVVAYERETIYSNLLDRTHEGVTIIQDERFVYLNARFAEIIGYSVADLQDEPFAEYIYPDEQPIIRDRYLRRMAGEDVPFQYETRLLHRNGQRITVELNARVVAFRGRPADFVFIRDITESKRSRKQVQRLLEQQIILNRLALSLGQMKQLNQIYETFTELVCRFLPIDLLFISFFDEAEQLIRADYAYAFGQTLAASDLPPLKLASADRGFQSQVIRTGEALYIPDYLEEFSRSETVHEVRPDGSVVKDVVPEQIEDPIRSLLYVPMQISGQTIGVMQVQSLLVDAYAPEDIELVLALANIAAIAIQNARLLAQTREQASQMQQIINIVPDGVVLLDSNLEVALANPAAQAYLALLSSWEMGKTVERLGERPLAELLLPSPTGLWHEVSIEKAVYEVIARPIDAGPATLGWVLVIHDGSKEHEIQQRVQQQERLASVGQLAAGIAHDFNNIMTIISLYVDLVQFSENTVSAKGRSRLNLIARQANRAVDLIQQILDFSRCAVLERRPLELLPFLKEVAKLLERTLVENVTIQFTYLPGQFVVNADPTRMQQMIVNLALNARDALPNGGRLQFDLAEVWVEDSTSAPLAEMTPGSWVRLTVVDDGNGIPPEVLPHIFDPFFTTKEPGKGTGLGLAQVWGIVKQHEGHIDVTSQMGVGTVFTIYLPNQGSITAVSTDEVPAALTFGHQEIILVAEDNPVTRQALVDSLLMMNYQVLTARNGREALNILEANPGNISLIISDVIMPEMGGISLIRAIKERDLPTSALLLTGHAQLDELEQFQYDPTVEWLPKPVSLEQLISFVTTMLPDPSA